MNQQCQKIDTWHITLINFENRNPVWPNDFDLQLGCCISDAFSNFFFRYPKSVDSSMEDLLKSAESEQTRHLMELFMNQMVFSVQHHLVPESSVSLTLSLNHRLPTVREKATQYLLKNLDEVRIPLLSIWFASLFKIWNTVFSHCLELG